MNKLDIIKAYHQQTKHRLEKYASGPETIDWDAQPSPFRYFEGCDYLELPLGAKELEIPYASLFQQNAVDAQSLSLHSLGIFFELALGLSAWKVYGQAKWSLRCNPSSGNLHPTEAYAIVPDLDHLRSGIYHYCPEKHGVEKRATFFGEKPLSQTRHFYLGLSSVAWREAWKYGERAFRYCQLDTGHALMSIRMAAATLGWRAQLSQQCTTKELSMLLGLDRQDDFHGDECEHAEVLIKVSLDGDTEDEELNALKPEFIGGANRLDRHHFYDWPIITDAFDATTASPDLNSDVETSSVSVAESDSTNAAVDIIKRRRSATEFNPDSCMSLEQFSRILSALLVSPEHSPWDIYPFNANISLVFFVHRVEGLRPGLYTLIRNKRHLSLYKNAMRDGFAWERTKELDEHLPFYRLLHANAQSAAGTLSCHQSIAANSAFCVSMISDYEDALNNGAGMYRHLHWEAGMIGQILYLEAEAINQRGTGIGCFFDDKVHETLGIQDDTLQVVYHFTVGEPVVDHRIASLSAYTDR